MSRHKADESPAADEPPATTIRPEGDRAGARAQLIEIIARQLVQDLFKERNANLPVRPIQH